MGLSQGIFVRFEKWIGGIKDVERDKLQFFDFPLKKLSPHMNFL
jgi:hypothetical protein